MMKNKKKIKNDLWIDMLLEAFESKYSCGKGTQKILPKYAKIIKLGTDYTYEEIGEVFHITRQRAEQLHKQAVGHLLAYINQH